MDIDFDAETPEGTIHFNGKLTKDEISFLLRFAILSLMARGSLPFTGEPDAPEDDGTPPVSLN